MEGSADDDDLEALDSWESADLDESTRRLMVSSKKSIDASSSELELAEAAVADPGGGLISDDDLRRRVDRFLREALEKPKGMPFPYIQRLNPGFGFSGEQLNIIPCSLCILLQPTTTQNSLSLVQVADHNFLLNTTSLCLSHSISMNLGQLHQHLLQLVSRPSMPWNANCSSAGTCSTFFSCAKLGVTMYHCLLRLKNCSCKVLEGNGKDFLQRLDVHFYAVELEADCWPIVL